MTPKEQMIESLKALCSSEELRTGTAGHIVVADKIGANDQTIWQIINGTRLPSGKPKGVGPELQEKLELNYPGWSNSLTHLSGGKVAHLATHRRTKTPSPKW